MKFEYHYEALKRLNKFGFVKVSDLSDSLNVTKGTIRSDLNEPVGFGYLTRCHDGTFIVLGLLDTIAKNEIAYALENYDTAQGIKKSHSAMKSQVYVIGSLNVNITSYLSRLPIIGESFLASNFIFSPGGKDCNQALVASFTDTDVYFITKVSVDHFSDYAINFTSSSKIYRNIVYQAKGTQTGTATIFVNEGTGDDAIVIYPSINTTTSSDEITTQKEVTTNLGVIPL